ncbi:GatB/YqeY domain-containing protein [Stappia sp. WLB 29]|uniref:GatB/YqeY domain-containing protein n=1 Tax=Stappia sp. WLB 29 TaxID=2925220 RepID=UPI0020C08A74|nr:GatB/YqeY domain-containing protein [Stappia sp. WLB 29]
MRERIDAALQDAVESDDKRRAATLRLMLAAIKDRDARCRELGHDVVPDAEIREILNKMLRQRESSVRDFEEAGQLDLAAQEREEMAVIHEFLPRQFDERTMQDACEDVVRDINARGLRDMGRCMNALKERYPGQMDFVRASCVVKDLLRSE